jgi:hypothetical protein
MPNNKFLVEALRDTNSMPNQPMSSQLNPSDKESQFQSAIRNTGWFKEFVNEYGEEPDLDTKDYDYRAAMAAGIQPERDPYDKNRYHWPSSLPSGQMLKAENHPTAWKEMFMRNSGQNPDALGIKSAADGDVYLRGMIGK